MSDTVIIYASEIAGEEHCICRADGDKVYKEVFSALSLDKDVTLCFTGVKTITSMFLEAAVGALYYTVTTKQIDRLTIDGLNQEGTNLAMIVCENASRDYTASLTTEKFIENCYCDEPNGPFINVGEKVRLDVLGPILADAMEVFVLVMKPSMGSRPKEAGQIAYLLERLRGGNVT